MQAMLAADCINQTSLFWVPHFITAISQIPQSAVEKEALKQQNKKQQREQHKEQHSIVGCPFLHFERLCWTPKDSTSLTCTGWCQNYA